MLSDKPFSYIDADGDVFIAGQKMPAMEYCDHMPELIHHINKKVNTIINETVINTLEMIKEKISTYDKNKEAWCGYEANMIDDMVSKLNISIQIVKLLRP